jgi:tetratricopeptide (TPR) repeat protein
MARSAELPVEEQPYARKSAEVRRLRRRPKGRYYAFLSYSHRDEELADWLHRELEDFHVPAALSGKLTQNGVVPKRLAPIFRDAHELAAADDLGEEIEQALASSQFLIVLCSPDAAKSRWTNAEIELFKRSRPEGCILAAIASGEPFASEIPGREHEECFPPALRHKYDRRGRPTNKRAEPLAADLRTEGQSRWIGFMKLVAGMLGVGLDDLIQRETTRRHKRMAWITAASVAGMLFASGLAFTAIRSRDEAREQRRQAEGLVAFMVGDLKDKLEPIGRLDALDGVGAKVLAYYKNQDPSKLSDAALLQRSRALSITAQVAYLRGNFEQAQALYRQARDGTAEAVNRSPDDPKRIFDLAQNVFWLGEIARTRGQTDEALTQYTEYKRLADRLLALEPDNIKWRMESLYGAENLGILLYNQRRFAEAARQLQEVVGPIAGLAAMDPGNLDHRNQLSTTLAWLADTQRSLGNLDTAVALRRRQIALLEQPSSAGSDVELSSQEVIAHQALGVLLLSRGKLEEAITELRSAVSRADQLVEIDSTSAIWRSQAATARLWLASALLAAGRKDEAAAQTDSGCAILSALRANADVFGRRTTCAIMRARLALATGDDANAVAKASEALSLARQTHNDDRLKDRFTIASIQRITGDAQRGLGNEQAAQAAWTSALGTLPQGTPELPAEMDEHATILQRLGRSDDALPIIQRLNAMGYKRVATSVAR